MKVKCPNCGHEFEISLSTEYPLELVDEFYKLLESKDHGEKAEESIHSS